MKTTVHGPLWSLYFRRFERVEEPLYYYYQHAVSTVHHITEEKCRDRMKAAELLYTECENRGFLAEYREQIEYRFTELYYVITLSPICREWRSRSCLL